jgi:hypothetical protein
VSPIVIFPRLFAAATHLAADKIAIAVGSREGKGKGMVVKI